MWHGIAGFVATHHPCVVPMWLMPVAEKGYSHRVSSGLFIMNGRSMQAWRAWAAPSPRSLKPGKESFSGGGAPTLHWPKNMTMLVCFACER